METWFWILGWFFSILTMTGNGFIILLVCTQTASSNQNQRLCFIPRSSRLFCWGDCCSFAVSLRKDRPRLLTRFIHRPEEFEVAVPGCISDQHVQFGTGSLHSCCEAFEILNLYDFQTCYPAHFLLLGVMCCFHFGFIISVI